jgi:uncharacterized protein (DUF924 family)
VINTEEIIKFWFLECNPKMWFKKKLDFDNLIKDKFSETIDMCLNTSFEDIYISSETYLSYIIVLDQFTRNAFRNTFESFVGDKKALKLCKNAIIYDFIKYKNIYYNSFFLMPLMHSENILDHELGIPLFKKYTSDNTYKFAKKHKEIVHNFGRFPHRNIILNRKSTDAEISFLKLPGSRF